VDILFILGIDLISWVYPCDALWKLTISWDVVACDVISSDLFCFFEYLLFANSIDRCDCTPFKDLVYSRIGSGLLVVTLQNHMISCDVPSYDVLFVYHGFEIL
jgi:hypothetical protein